jgi:hypothetical protein
MISMMRLHGSEQHEREATATSTKNGIGCRRSEALEWSLERRSTRSARPEAEMLQEISADLTDCSGLMTEKSTREQGVGEGMGKVCPLQRACVGRKGVLPARTGK